MADEPAEVEGVAEIDVQELDRMISEREVLAIDVRETDEYEEAHIPGTLLLPLSFLDADLFPIIADKKIVVTCQTGKRSAAAAKQLMQNGVPDVINLQGGVVAWEEAGLEMEGTKFE